MAIIGKSSKAPKINWLEQLPTLDEGEIIVFLRPDEQYYTASNMVMSMAATCIGRHGTPFKASNLEAVSRIGIFSTWEAKKKMGQLCDAGYFSRQHVGKEEYFSPEQKFFEFLEKTKFEVRS